MNLSIIIINYNVKYFLENTIGSVIKSAKDFSFEIIVVDNASSDNSEEYVLTRFKNEIEDSNTSLNLKYIYNNENVGFSKANNQGLKIAKGEKILILNPDTLLNEDTITELFEYSSGHPDSKFYTCKVITPDGKIDTSCHRSFPTAWNSFCHISGLSKVFNKSQLFSSYNLLYKPENEIYEVDAISGCFMFFDREIIDKNIFLPEDYFMYGEDLDFCFQVKKNGYKVEYVPITEIIHYRGQSSKKDKIKMRKYFYQSMNIFVKKHYSQKYSILFKLMLNIGIMFAYLFSVLSHFFKTFLLPIIDIISYVIALIISVSLHDPIVQIIGQGRLFTDSNVSAASYSIISIVYILIILLIFYYTKIYTINKFSYRKFLTSSSYIALLMFSSTFLVNIFSFSRLTLVSILILSTLFMFGWRVLILKKLKMFYNKTLIVGIDDVSIKLLDEEKTLSNDGIIIGGYIDINDDNLGKNVKKYPVFGNINNLEDVIKLENIEIVMYSLKSLSLEKIIKSKEKLDKLNVKIKILPDFLKIKKNRIQYVKLDS